MDEIRRQMFLAYFQTQLKGDRAALIKRAKLTKGRVSQLFDESEPFGERAARNLAERLGLPETAFLGMSAPADMPAPLIEEPLSPEALSLATLFDNFKPEHRRYYLAVLSAEIVSRLPGGPLSNTPEQSEPRSPRLQRERAESPAPQAPDLAPEKPGTARPSK